MGQAINRRKEYILSLSYGKDSLACLGAIEELGWPLDRIIHAEVWATDTIPADLERTIAAHNADPGAHNSLAARMLAIETALNGSGTIIQAGDPTVETVGQKGQHYINPETGAEFECVEVNESGYIWNPVEDGKSVRDLLGALGNAETTLADVDARLGLLELMYRTQVNGNPFTVSFSDMSGLVVTGVWNETLKRVEF